MLVVVALVGIIAGGIAMTISQVMAVNSRSSNHMIALRQVQQAGDRVSRDVLQAQPSSINHSPGGGKFITLAWIVYDDEEAEWQDVEVEYELISTGDGLARLQRTHSRYSSDDSGRDLLTRHINTVARYIVDDPAKTSLVPTGGAYLFMVTAHVGTWTETAEYKVDPRITRQAPSE